MSAAKRRRGSAPPRWRGAARLTALSCAVALAGCAAVGPDYVEPVVESPPSWTSSSARPAAAPTSAAPSSLAPSSVDPSSPAPPTRPHARDPAALAAWWSQFADPVLDGLVADALSANVELAAARARLREARARRALAAAQLGPTVSASASATGGRASAESGSGSHYERYGAGFDARWEADVFGGLRRGLEAADADVGASVAGLRETQVTLAAEVALNYVDLRLAERRVAVAQASLAARRETFDIVRWRSQAGLVSELDVAQARTDLESTLANLPPFRSAAAEARHRLAVLLGRPPGELTERLASGAAIPIAGEAVALGIPADTLRQRPDVRAAERQVAARTARLGQAMAARYPSFTLSGSVGLEALALSALGNGGAGAVSLLGAVGAPIFDSGRIAANVEIQDALLEQALAAYRATVLGALEDVENALASLSAAAERRARLAAATESARTTLRIAEQRYASGLSDFLAVLDGQRTLLSLEEQLAGSTGALASAQIQLYKALGGGWSPDSPPIGAKETR